MSKAILFDLWGTLMETGVRSPLKRAKEILQIDLPFSDYVLRMEKVMMTKPFTELKEAFLAVAQEFAVPCSEEQLELLIGMWNKSWMLARPYAEVRDVLTELQGQYLLILISNTDCFSVAKVLEKWNFGQYFTQIYLSCETGLLKTDPALFEKIFQDHQLKKEDCLLVGDSLESDMGSAQKAGIRSILIDPRNSREFEPKIKNLLQLDRYL